MSPNAVLGPIDFHCIDNNSSKTSQNIYIYIFLCCTEESKSREEMMTELTLFKEASSKFKHLLLNPPPHDISN